MATSLAILPHGWSDSFLENRADRKDAGAYYTDADVAGHMAERGILAFLFSRVQGRQSSIGGRDPVETVPWRRLAEEPERYLPAEMRHGTERPLPGEVAAGQSDVARRASWDRPADEAWALPRETWRECVARREHYTKIHEALRSGRIRSVRELLTCNVDLLRLALDAIKECDDPFLLRAWHEAIRTVKVLDPTCGAGAFLLAALDVFEPLHGACLERMAGWLRSPKTNALPLDATTSAAFQKILAEADAHGDRRCFVRKWTMLNNLHGVDLMSEAIEICKRHLLLKLVGFGDATAQSCVLPDLDFNLVVGNALVGHASTPPTVEGVDLARAQKQLARRLENFRRKSTDPRTRPEEILKAKTTIQRRLDVLGEALDRHLAATVPTAAMPETVPHERSRPLHWSVAFADVMQRGGFDVVLGNPPYLERKQVNYRPRGLTANGLEAVHALCIKRSCQVLRPEGTIGMVVPLALVSTRRMREVRARLETGRDVWYAHFSWRPAKLFETVNRAMTIFIAMPARCGKTFSTTYQKWYSETRPLLLPRMTFVEVPRRGPDFWVPKLGAEIERSLLAKCLSVSTRVKDFMAPSAHAVYYRTDGGLYWKVFTDFPPAFTLNGHKKPSSRQTRFTLARALWLRPAIAALSSDVFWWWYTVTSNCRHLNPYDIQHFPLPASVLEDPELERLGAAYLEDLQRHSRMRSRRQRQTGRTETQTFTIRHSRPLLERIGKALAPHYGFDPFETDFLLHFEIKFRLGVPGDPKGI